MSQLHNKAIDSDTDIRSKFSKVSTAKPQQVDRYFIKLGAKNKKQVTLRSIPSLTNIVSSASIKEEPLDRTVVANPYNNKVTISKKHQLNYVYEEIEFDPLKKDEFCTDKCVIY